MEKKNYQTISSDKALIIKNSARSSGQTESLQKKLQHRVTEG